MTYAVSPEMQTKIVDWRAKCLAGTITLDEMREAIKALRANRIAAATASAKSLKTGKKKAPAQSADSMLDELGL